MKQELAVKKGTTRTKKGKGKKSVSTTKKQTKQPVQAKQGEAAELSIAADTKESQLQPLLQLETDKLVLERYANKLDSELYNLARKRQCPAPVFQRPPLVKLGISLVLLPLICMGGFYAAGFLATGAVNFTSRSSYLEDCLANAQTAAIAGLFAGLLLAIIYFATQWFKAENQYKKQLEEFKKNSRAEMQRLRWETALKAQLEPLQPRVQQALQQTEETLQNLYTAIKLPAGCQNLVCVGTILGYLQNGKAKSFGGKKGAVALYIKEAEEGLIAANTYEAYSMPQGLQEQQPLVHSAVTKARKQVQQLCVRKGKTALEQGQEAQKALEQFIEDSAQNNQEAQNMQAQTPVEEMQVEAKNA